MPTGSFRRRAQGSSSISSIGEAPTLTFDLDPGRGLVKWLDQLYDNVAKFTSPGTRAIFMLRLGSLVGTKFRSVIQARCQDMVYDTSTGPWDDRFDPTDITGQLLASHEVFLLEADGGDIASIVCRIDPNAEAVGWRSPRDSRQTVADYASEVHDGYVQYVFGKNTGIFHSGRPWFKVGADEAMVDVIEIMQSEANYWAERIMGGLGAPIELGEEIMVGEPS